MTVRPPSKHLLHLLQVGLSLRGRVVDAGHPRLKRAVDLELLHAPDRARERVSRRLQLQPVAHPALERARERRVHDPRDHPLHHTALRGLRPRVRVPPLELSKQGRLQNARQDPAQPRLVASGALRPSPPRAKSRPRLGTAPARLQARPNDPLLRGGGGGSHCPHAVLIHMENPYRDRK
jgi:hypothetical protein